MIFLLLLTAILAAAVAIVFAWPWVDPLLERHDARNRLLDRLEEEWEREDDAVTPDWRW
jgi:cell division protein FtsL